MGIEPISSDHAVLQVRRNMRLKGEKRRAREEKKKWRKDGNVDEEESWRWTRRRKKSEEYASCYAP